ncbi:universal stress protein [Paraburkholderia guartelaensis]|uniref:universal stress protein n=1 Tax=Paraburkholderia guartelaensis TaxID=2546446 RepID=UPI002AB7BA61|nr:universal stress protein [Paraburkholderia guartelaensis]
MFCDLLVHVDGNESGQRRVQFAIDMALSTGARLCGIHVTPPAEVPPRYKPSRVADVTAHLASRLALEAEAAAKVFSEQATKRLSDLRWFEAHGDIAEGISHRARYADLVILGQYEWQGPPETHPLPIAHSVVLRCGRPVVVVPAAVGTTSLSNIAVAWDGSREAVRAVHDALPLLRLARSIHIITIIAPSAQGNQTDVDSLLAHLAGHGIGVRTDALQIRTVEHHDSLRKQIEQGPYDLLVMGAYSHPMWMEFIFGGVTQTTLLSSKIPVLVSH